MRSGDVCISQRLTKGALRIPRISPALYTGRTQYSLQNHYYTCHGLHTVPEYFPHCRTSPPRTPTRHLNTALILRILVCLCTPRLMPKALRYKCLFLSIGRFPRTTQSLCKHRNRLPRSHNLHSLRIFLHHLCIRPYHGTHQCPRMSHYPDIFHRSESSREEQARK